MIINQKYLALIKVHTIQKKITQNILKIITKGKAFFSVTKMNKINIVKGRANQIINLNSNL